MAKDDEKAGQRAVRALSAAMAVVSAGLIACAALAWWRGGLYLQLGPIDISVAMPLRPTTQALAVLLLREALGVSSGRQARLRFLGLFAALVACLAGDSRPQVVGDGHDYVAMAWNLSMGRPPALTEEEIGRVESSLLPPRIDGYPLVTPELRGADGLQYFYHFWAYSLLAAPLVRMAVWLGLPVLPAFTVLNCLLLLTAAFVLLTRCGPRVTLLILGGPILWWIDKAHTEVYTVALLVVAIALLPTRPGISLTALGLVALQNSTLGVTLVSSSTWLLRRNRLRETGARAGLAVALLLFATGPAYYFWRIGHPSPQSWTVLPHWPSLSELSAVLVDTNLGLAFAWPSLVLAVALAVICPTTTRASAPLLKFDKDTLVLLAGTAAVILFIVTQPMNLNHGGTRGVSRYALCPRAHQRGNAPRLDRKTPGGGLSVPSSGTRPASDPDRSARGQSPPARAAGPFASDDVVRPVRLTAPARGCARVSCALRAHRRLTDALWTSPSRPRCPARFWCAGCAA